MGYQTSLPITTVLLVVAAVGFPMVLCMLRSLTRSYEHRTAVHDLHVRVAHLRIGILRRAAAFGQLDDEDDVNADVEILDARSEARRAA